MLSKNILSTFVLQEDSKNLIMPLKLANMLLGNKRNLYNSIKSYGLFLPKLGNAVTAKYLIKVSKGEAFWILEKDVKFPPEEKIKFTKTDLVAYLEDKHISNPSLGFDPQNLPNRKWLLTLLFTFEPNHYVFTAIHNNQVNVDVPIWYYKLYITI